MLLQLTSTQCLHLMRKILAPRDSPDFRYAAFKREIIYIGYYARMRLDIAS